MATTREFDVTGKLETSDLRIIIGTTNVLESGILTAASMKHSVADFPQNVVQSLTKMAITGIIRLTVGGKFQMCIPGISSLTFSPPESSFGWTLICTSES